MVKLPDSPTRQVVQKLENILPDFWPEPNELADELVLVYCHLCSKWTPKEFAFKTKEPTGWGCDRHWEE